MTATDVTLCPGCGRDMDDARDWCGHRWALCRWCCGSGGHHWDERGAA